MKIAIIGAGYVGLPLAIALSNFHTITCYDIDKKRIKNLKSGFDINNQHSKSEILKKKINFTDDKYRLLNNYVYIITVPTPISDRKKPNLNMLRDASILVGKTIKKKSIIIYESTTFPGCTEEFCIPLIEKFSKLKFNKDFYVGYSPERVNPGDNVNTLENITKIVGANNPSTLLKLKKLYKSICKSVYTTNSIKIAESAKVIENTQRDINIALVNELGKLFNKLDIPTNEVLKAAATKWNFHYYKPGLVGGHCISVDPYYLSYKAQQKKYSPKLILSGRRINESMGKHVAQKTISLLRKNKIKLSTSKIAILGFSFKDNIPDIRNTKIIQIFKELKKKILRLKYLTQLFLRLK
jgi:UDP-N-acetyl-D-galactosamine dehydrogenase